MHRLDHGAKLHDIPDEHLAEILKTLKKIAVAQGVENYNILQVRTVCFSFFWRSPAGPEFGGVAKKRSPDMSLCALAEQRTHRSPRSRRTYDSRFPLEAHWSLTLTLSAPISARSLPP